MDAETKHLVRIQLLSPLSTLVALGVNLGAAALVHPSLGDINDDYLTILTPNKNLIGGYWLVLFLLQIGYALLLSLVRKEETKKTVVNAVGIRFPLANVAMAVWGVLWSFRLFFLAEICLLVAFVLMVTVYIGLLMHPASKSRPLDYLCIHTMCRMFLIILFVVDIWQGGLLGLSWYKYLGEHDDPRDRKGKWEGEHSKHNWIAFGVVLVTGLINAFIVFIGRDFIWTAASVYLYVALIIKGPKPVQVFIPLILMAAFQIIALLSSCLYWYCSNKEGRIALPSDEEEGQTGATPAGIDSHSERQSQLEAGRAGAASPHPREVEDL